MPRPRVLSAQDPIFQLLPGMIQPLKEVVSRSKRPLEAETRTNNEPETQSKGAVRLQWARTAPLCVGKIRLCG